MFKVSFNNKKIQTHNNKVTIVTLNGVLHFPKIVWAYTTGDIMDWMWHHPTVDVSPFGLNGTLIVSGKSTCSDGDTFDAVKGERIAECRAKIRLYKFIAKLCEKILRNSFTTMYGNAEISRFTESHANSPQDCVWLARKKYIELLSREIKHEKKLLSEL